MKKILPLAIASALLSACSGSGGGSNSNTSGGNVFGLTMPENMSVVSATDSGGGSRQTGCNRCTRGD